MAACRKITCLTMPNQFHIIRSLARYSTGTNVKSDTGSNEIVVPYRIERGPTDILKALASTVSKDPLAAHYKYEDDPYLIPSSNVTKRAFSLSKESGRKAAHYFLEKYPELFIMNKSVPFIKQFDPPVVYTEENVTSIEPLRDCIKNGHVDNSVKVYEILKKKGIAVSQEIKQDLLDLLCFYNGSQPPPEDYWEERFYHRSAGTPSEKWNGKGRAEELFEEMEKDGRAYSSMIAGTAKFSNADRALFLYEEMQSKSLKATLLAYNNLISVVHHLKEDNATRWEFAILLLSKMRADQIRPDLNTMNALFLLLSKCSRWNRCKANTLRVLAEMRKLKIEPSLGTYHYVLMIFCSYDFSSAGILHEIMSELEGKQFQIKHPSDTSFFVTAMEVCFKGIGDKELAYRLHTLLEFGSNSKLLGNSLSESVYFKFFFRLLCDTEEMDKLMEIYEKYVPNMYTPEPSVTLAIIQAIHFNGAYKYLPRMCSDVLLFEHTERANIIELLMDAAGSMKHDEQVQRDTINMVWNIVEKLKQRAQGRRLPFDWTGATLGNILYTFMNGNEIEKSWEIIKRLKEEETSIIGYPQKECLLKFCELCLETGNFDKVSYCMKYAINGSYTDFKDDVEELTKKMFEQNRLATDHMVHVNNLLQSASNIDQDSSSSSSSGEDSSSDSSSDDEKEGPSVK